MTATDLADEFDCWKAGLRRCGCGSSVVLTYQPGMTAIYCLAEKSFVFGLPDWCPRSVNEQWNQQTHT